MENRVRELRERNGLTQEQLTSRVGGSRQTIISIETGRFNPSLVLAYKLANNFGRSIEEVFIFSEPEGGEQGV